MCLNPPSKSPFNRLPIELKIEVFVHDLNSYRKRFESDLRRRPMILAAVCKEWQKVVWSSPQLWSKISLDFTRSEENTKAFHVYIQNSKNHPLDVAIIFHNAGYRGIDMSEFLTNWFREVETEKSHQVSEVLKVLNVLHESNRLKSLNITFGSADAEETATNIANLIKGGLPMLEMLQLRSESVSHLFDIDSDMFLNCPKLRDLSIYSIPLNPVILASCTQVTGLTLTLVPLESCMNAVTYMPNLAHIQFNVPSGSAPHRFRFHNGSSIFVHTSIISLKLDEYLQDIASVVLGRFSFPSLRMLHIKNWTDTQSNSALLRAATQFVIRSGCALKYLCLITRYVFESDIWSLLDCVHTTVETLKLMPDIRLNFDTSDILYGLLKRFRSPTYFPRVEKILFEERLGQLDYAVMSGHLMKRMKNWPSDTDIRPSLFKVVLMLEELIPSNGEVERKIVKRFQTLKDKGMEVSLKVRPGYFRPNPILKALEEGEETVYSDEYGVSEN